MKRTFARHGLGYTMLVPELATELAVDRLARRSGEVQGELTVSCGLPGTRSVDGHLHQARFNLSSTTARGTLAKVLVTRSGASDIDWQDLLEDFCRRVLMAERQGEPVEFVGDRPQRIAPAWRLDPILPHDKPTILYGEGGTGKSTLATAIAVSVETGVAVVEGWIPRRASVLYLDWETSADDVDEHVKAIAAGANIPGQVRLRYRRCFGPLADQTDEIARLVAEHGIGLVIVDSVGMASGSSSDGADASESAIRLFGAFRAIGTTVLAIDHVSKADTDPTKPARPYGCYSADTEVLTKQGWVRHDELGLLPEVLAYDSLTEKLSWERPQQVHAYRFDGELVRWSTKATHSLVTPNHRMVARPDWPSGRDQPWRFVTPDEISTADWRLVAAGSPPDGRYAMPEAQIRLMGWWIAEGSVQRRRLRLSQNAGPMADRIDATLAELGFAAWRHEQPRPSGATHVTWVINGRQELADQWAEDCGTSALTKRLPPYAFDLTLALRQTLLEALIDGDGHRRPSGGMSYHTSSPRLADDVQRLAILNGFHADVRRDEPDYLGEARPTYRVMISPPGRTTTSFRPDRSSSRESYHGTVYCLTVPSGAYVTRLDGRMAIQGNSVYKTNLARATFELRRATPMGDIARIGVFNTKSNVRRLLAPIGLEIEHTDEGVIRYQPFDIAGDAELGRKASVWDRARAVLADGDMSDEELAEELEVKANVLRATLSRVAKQGLVERLPSSKKWRLIHRAS